MTRASNVTPLHRGAVYFDGYQLRDCKTKLAVRGLPSIPLQHTAKALADARAIGNPRVLGEPSAVFARTTRAPRDDTPQHVRQADNLRRFYAANPRLDGPPRHVRIEPRIDWPTVLAWWALALSLGCIVYFGAQLLRGALS